jgi:transposase
VIDVLPARSAVAVTEWLAAKPTPWLAGIGHVVIDPLPPLRHLRGRRATGARLVVDHFHVIRLANAALDEVRRRVQQTTTCHRGRKTDALYRGPPQAPGQPRLSRPRQLRPSPGLA